MTEPLDRLWTRHGSGFLCAALLGTVLVTVGFIVLTLTEEEVHPVNPGLVLLLLTLLVSATFGFRAGIIAAILSNILVAFFFIRPAYSFEIEDPEELLSLGVFTLASAIGSSLLQTYRLLADRARYGQAQAEALLSLNRSIIGQSDPHLALEEVARQLMTTFEARDAAVLVQEDGAWRVIASAGDDGARPVASEAGVARAQAAMTEGAIQRYQGPSDEVVLVPLVHAGESLGVLRVSGPFGDTPFRASPDGLLQAFAGEAALAITRIELAMAVRRAEALKESDATKTAILNSISHDLKTPLATIKAATSSLLDSGVAWSKDDLNAFLANIELESDRLDRTISELLDLNRLQAGAVTPILEPVSLADVVDSAVEVAGAAIGQRQVKLSVPDVTVVTDATLLRHALVNLIENALVHSRAGGEIRVRADFSQPDIELMVEDEGPGPDPRDLPYIFDPFFRSGRPGLRAAGSGLGLAIVKGFVTLCGGSVDATSAGDGSVFTIRLPKRSVPEAARV